MREWNGYLEHLTEDKLFDPRENAGKGHYTCFSVMLRDMGCLIDFQGLPWCVTFVFALFWQTFGRESAIQLLGYPIASSGFLRLRMRLRGRWRDKSYRPKKYDLVFYSGALDGKPSHIGIILSADSEGYESIEGNTADPLGYFPPEVGGAVAIRQIKYDYPYILGYAEIGATHG